jgi:6-phosphogluconolactonase (cycloisomerase 2 family)
MRKSLGWTAGILTLVAIGVTIACSGKYSAQNNGLIVVPSRADNVVQTFSLNLSNGGVSQINNPSFPFQNGLFDAVVLHPTLSVAYMLILQDPTLANSIECNNMPPPETACIAVSQIASDGKAAAPTMVSFNTEGASCSGVVPVAMAVDSAGKYLFVADSVTSGSCPGAVSVFSIDSAGNLTEISGSPFVLPTQPGGQTASASALAVTPTIYPNQYAVCQQQAGPSTENLYVTDSVNYVVLNYSVNLSSGALTLVPPTTSPDAPTGVATGAVPSGVAVDPCNRFLYVANEQGNTVSAYMICSAVSINLNCPVANFSLNAVANSPFATGYAPGPLAVDAYGNFLYVVATGSSYINAFRMSSSTGALSPITPATYALSTALGQISGANSIAIRNDDSFLFVANSNSETLSEFGVVPSTGTLSPLGAVSTFNYPSGVAVSGVPQR